MILKENLSVVSINKMARQRVSTRVTQKRLDFSLLAISLNSEDLKTHDIGMPSKKDKHQISTIRINKGRPYLVVCHMKSRSTMSGT